MILGDLGVVLASKSLPRDPTKAQSASILAPLWGHFGGHLAVFLFEFNSVWYIFSDMFPIYEKGAKMELPRGGVDMQSDDACACFVRVGRRHRGSIWGSILEPFWAPKSLLYYLLAFIFRCLFSIAEETAKY